MSDTVSLQELTDRFHGDVAPLLAVADRYPFRLTRYYASLIESPGDPIWRQAVPAPDELNDLLQVEDPLDEGRLSPVPGLIHRYPDRVVMLVTNACAMYCRFCMRKRMVGTSSAPTCSFDEALAYIRHTKTIKDVLLSGGDPLLLPVDVLDGLLSKLRAIPHVDIIRIGTRLPVTDPDCVSQAYCRMLAKHRPLYINTHFNHPRELTSNAEGACSRLQEAGLLLGNQTVLLRGVNDNPEILMSLNRGLLKMGVKPYYLHQMDLVKGTRHFRTPLQTGLSLIHHLRGRLSGLGVPHFMVDLPGGKGKLALLEGVGRREGNDWLFENWEGEEVRYPDLPEA